MLADHDGHVPNRGGKGQHQQPSMPETENNPSPLSEKGFGRLLISMGMISVKGQVQAIEKA
jgi:hypothetical protein